MVIRTCYSQDTSHNHFNNICQSIVIIIGLIGSVVGNPLIVPLKLTFIESCDTCAVFQCALHEEAEGNPQNCSIHYKISGSDSQYNIQQFLFTDKDVTIRDLQRNKSYEAFVVCDGDLKSDPLSFTVGNQCQNSGDDQDSEVTVKERQIFSSSITDIVLGIIFGLVAMVIVVVTVYYQYRKYLRRRRLQQYLNTPHTDPFESLQDHMEDQEGRT